MLKRNIPSMPIKGINSALLLYICILVLGCDIQPKCSFSTKNCRIFVDSEFVEEWRIGRIEGFVNDGTNAKFDSIEVPDSGLNICKFLDSLISKTVKGPIDSKFITLIVTLIRKGESRQPLVPQECVLEFNSQMLKVDTTISALAKRI
jgi:hypothetical protein